MADTNSLRGSGDGFPFPLHTLSGIPGNEAEDQTRPHHRTVDRIAAILETVARSAVPKGLSEIAKELGAPVSSTQSLVNGLAATGFLEEDGRGFRLGMTPYFLATLAGRRPVDQVTRSMLEDVVEGTGGVAVVAVLVGGSVFYIDYATDDPAYEYLAQNRLRRSPLETSAGWVLLSGLDVDTTWSQLAVGEDAGVDRDLVNAFERAYPQIRESGECVAPGAARNGADGVAVAVRNRGEIVAAVSVIAAEEHLRENKEMIRARLRAGRALWDR